MRVLLELRPALSGHAGIPQETRLLFRGLNLLDGVAVDGLMQSSNRVIAAGLPPQADGWSEDRRVNRLSRVVVSLQQSSKPSRLERLGWALQLTVKPLQMLLRTLLGLPTPLGRFEPERFRDFVWRAMFAKTLPPADFEAVTSAGFRVSRLPWSALHQVGLLTARFGHAVYPRLDTRGYDVMVAETPYPGRVTAGTALVVRYHDAIPLLMPHTISDRSYHQASHYRALRRNVADGAWFACVSDATRRDLLSVFPEAAPRAVTIHNMVSHHYFAEDSSPRLLPEIVNIRRSQSVKGGGGRMLPAGQRMPPYLLMVSTIEPRKNHLALLSAWEQLRTELQPELQLVLVGALGWEHKAIVRRFRPWLDRGGMHLLEDVPAPELRMLYRHAAVTVCPSFGEGFDFSGVEAMRCGGIVAASDIAVHHDIFADAAEYFTPYSAGQLAATLARLLSADAVARRAELVARGAEVSASYLPERVLPQWQAFLQNLPRR
jgi:glycosyltransferase involved in cell wall biosynthesis